MQYQCPKSAFLSSLDNQSFRLILDGKSMCVKMSRRKMITYQLGAVHKRRHQSGEVGFPKDDFTIIKLNM